MLASQDLFISAAQEIIIDKVIRPDRLGEYFEICKGRIEAKLYPKMETLSPVLGLLEVYACNKIIAPGLEAYLLEFGFLESTKGVDALLKKATKSILFCNSQFLSTPFSWLKQYTASRAALQLQGIFAGMKEVDFDIFSLFVNDFVLLSEEYLSIDFSSNTSLVECYFDAIRYVCTKATWAHGNFDLLWEELLLGIAKPLVASTEIKLFADLIVQKTWNKDFRSQLIRKCKSDYDLSNFFINSTQLSALCALMGTVELSSLIEDIINEIQDPPIVRNMLGFYLASFESLLVLARASDSNCDRVVDYLSSFSMGPNATYSNFNDHQKNVLCECVGQTLAGVLDHVIKQNPTSSILKTTIFQNINLMHSSSKKIQRIADPMAHGHDLQIYANAIINIANIARVSKPNDVVEIIIPAMVRRIEENSDDYNKYAWSCLCNIGMSFNIDIFRAVIQFVFNGSHPLKQVTEVGELLANMPNRPIELMAVYLDRLLSLFLERAALLQKTNELNHLSEMKDLVKIISMVISNQYFRPDVLETAHKRLTHHLRNMWFYLVLYVLEPRGTWPSEWYEYVKLIASRTPALLLDKDDRSLEVNLNSDSILIGTFPSSLIDRVTTNLAYFCRNSSVDVSMLPWEIATYLVAVCQVEGLRMKSLSLDYLFSYLVDDRLQSLDVYNALEGITDYIFRKIFYDAEYKKVSVSIVENHIQLLLVHSAHRNQNVRKFAMDWANRVLHVVPQILFNRNMMFYMLDILSFLDSFNNQTGKLTGIFGQVLVYSSNLEVEESAFFFAGICEDWILSALKTCYREALPLFQSYVAELNSSTSWIAAQTTGMDGNSSRHLLRLCTKIFAMAEYSGPWVRFAAAQSKYIGEINGLIFSKFEAGQKKAEIMGTISKHCRERLKKLYSGLGASYISTELHDALFSASAWVVKSENSESELIQFICNAPRFRFDSMVVDTTLEALGWIMSLKPALESQVMCRMIQVWEATARKRVGIYSPSIESKDPFKLTMSYGAPKPKIPHDDSTDGHLIWVNFLLERFDYERLQSLDYLQRYCDFCLSAFSKKYNFASGESSFRARFALAELCLKVAQELSRRKEPAAVFLWSTGLEAIIEIFASPPIFGKITKAEIKHLIRFYNVLKNANFENYQLLLQAPLMKTAFELRQSKDRVDPAEVKYLAMILTGFRIHRFATWIYPLSEEEAMAELDMPAPINERNIKWPSLVKTAWRMNPKVAIFLLDRFPNYAPQIKNAIFDNSQKCEIKVVSCAAATNVYLKGSNKYQIDPHLRHLLYWQPVNPVVAIEMLSDSQKLHPWVLQFAFHSLEYFPVNLVFFYIPQLVQALRRDEYGYIEKFILDAAKTSQYFAHQIIWNMEANKFRDEGGEQPDILKPVLERIIDKIKGNLTGEDKEFFVREFGFFKEVTDISGKLKPLVMAGATKPEKKVIMFEKRKIDEEIAKIKVDVGVYLPTNPDKTVVDIDYTSGRPLQSHAKAPFMATFKVQSNEEPAIWMSNIFKVGDDCRQDVLALQLISVFQSIFDSAGLDLYTYAYRVVATAPGCAVIENIPNSISRDMMGREKVNNLFDWYVAKFGAERTLSYKSAQKEFVKSLAGYSLIMFLLQFKDRHNGNIMFDLQGHIIHIDFGFMLSNAPGGGLFETTPFKVTNEMVQVMGGMVNSPLYEEFCELVVKAFLVSRLYANEIITLVTLMADSGLACFKGEVTIRKLRERFQLGKSDRMAAEFMMNCVRQSHETTRSGIYDRFQYFQNGIPYN